MLQRDMCSLYRVTRRDLFVASKKASDWMIQFYKCPEYGPDGKSVFIDTFYSGPSDHVNAKKALVVIGGTHGVEGAAGSLVLQGIINGELRNHLPSDTCVLLINALSPWGYSHGRRVNENNVDLNRNAPEPFPDGEKNPLMEVFRPYAWDEERVAELIKEGGEGLKDVITRGQYQYPDGLFYGGRCPSWSMATFREICALFLGRCKHVAVLDIHTGLGKYAEGEILSPVTDNKTTSRLRSWFESSGTNVRLVNKSESVSSPITGDILSGLVRWFPDSQVTPVALEFGTGVHVLESLPRLVKENSLFHNPAAFTTEESEEIQTKFIEVFFQEDPKWQSTLWNYSLHTLVNLIDGLGTSEEI